MRPVKIQDSIRCDPSPARWFGTRRDGPEPGERSAYALAARLFRCCWCCVVPGSGGWRLLDDSTFVRHVGARTELGLGSVPRRDFSRISRSPDAPAPAVRSALGRDRRSFDSLRAYESGTAYTLEVRYTPRRNL